MSDRERTQDEPVMDGATAAGAEEKWQGLVEQSDADHPDSAPDAEADAERRRADLEHDDGSNQPQEHRPTGDDAVR